jgi:TonB family protein
MTHALLYQSAHKRRFGAALGLAALVHLAAISFGTSQRPQPATPAGSAGDPPEITFESPDPIPDPSSNETDPLPAPPAIEQLFIEEPSTPPPVRRQVRQATPITRPRTSAHPGATNLSTAKVFAVSAPRPEYPYEARRQKITGEGIVVMSVDPVSGSVTSVSMARTTGSPFLDNAAMTGFKRWRFKPGVVLSVTCPVSFTLTGASY